MKTTLLIITLLFPADISFTWELWTPCLAVVLAAFAAPWARMCALRDAPEGYEDEEGFHSKQSRLRIRHSFGFGVLRPENAG